MVRLGIRLSFQEDRRGHAAGPVATCLWVSTGYPLGTPRGPSGVPPGASPGVPLGFLSPPPRPGSFLDPRGPPGATLGVLKYLGYYPGYSHGGPAVSTLPG